MCQSFHECQLPARFVQVLTNILNADRRELLVSLESELRSNLGLIRETHPILWSSWATLSIWSFESSRGNFDSVYTKKFLRLYLSFQQMDGGRVLVCCFFRESLVWQPLPALYALFYGVVVWAWDDGLLISKLGPCKFVMLPRALRARCLMQVLLFADFGNDRTTSTRTTHLRWEELHLK